MKYLAPVLETQGLFDVIFSLLVLTMYSQAAPVKFSLHMHPPVSEISHIPLPEQYSGQFNASIIFAGTYKIIVTCTIFIP